MNYNFRPRFFNFVFLIFSPSNLLMWKHTSHFVKYCMEWKLILDPTICNMMLFNVSLLLKFLSHKSFSKNILFWIMKLSSYLQIPDFYFYAPAIKWQGGIKCLLCPLFRPSVPSKFVFSTPPTSLHGFEWNLVQILYNKSRSACREIIHVQQILAELWPLTLRIFTHFSLSSQLLLHRCMDLNETWYRCCTTSLEVHVGR